MAEKKQPTALIIFDGFGITVEKRGNAIAAAKTPNLNQISQYYPGTTLRASGVEVGLAWGEMGSSEVGHANMGAGLVVYQNLEKINLAIRDGSFAQLPAWKRLADHAVKNNSNIHLMGLLSNGGVHSHIEHILAILRNIKDLNYKGKVFIHAFTDGQDVAPQSALIFLSILKEEMSKIKIGEIATVMGRYYAMDKNEEWERTQKAYDCLTEGSGVKAADPEQAILDSYSKEVKDEHIKPVVIVDKKNQPVGLVKEGDVLMFFNFRADRARQITRSFIFADKFDKFPVKKFKNLLFVPLTQYGLDYPVEPAFPLQNIKNPLAKVVSDAGKTQFHIAEAEKYAHVTYFFNGGLETPFPGEDRGIIPSKKVKGFDEKPEMSAHEITGRVISELGKNNYDLYVINFANGDIVGHTGNFKAAVKAIEVLDECIGKIKDEVLKLGGTLVITGDHGNVEEMINLETGETDKEHSTNPVPFWVISADIKKTSAIEGVTQVEPGGILADISPTILELMGISKPEEMTGSSLINVVSYCPLPKE
ncbi:MAG: 2,3-bisphosphoglycerate-independent phosphoglycerate mutase [Candidatus Harrisonbacteria bacterium]|nr:2,3-bisphosphoglycerate-independent phosphoglycerate mutase [Candidatus Harrisonbacteria bacterium]